jgi:putative glutamine amidotransferase
MDSQYESTSQRCVLDINQFGGIAMKPIIGVTPQYDIENDRIKIEPSYFQAIKKSGGVPILLPLHNDTKDLEELLSCLDGILFSGGPDVNPLYFNEEAIPECGSVVKERDLMELSLLPLVMQKQLPILAICRGIQTVNIALGGDIYQDIKAQTECQVKIMHYQKAKSSTTIHKVQIVKDTLLERILHKDVSLVNSFHHQVVRNLGKELTVAATSSDGLIEAVTMENYPFFLGVQWHPEELYEVEEDAQRIFHEFIAAAISHKCCNE